MDAGRKEKCKTEVLTDSGEILLQVGGEYVELASYVGDAEFLDVGRETRYADCGVEGGEARYHVMGRAQLRPVPTKWRDAILLGLPCAMHRSPP